MNRRKCRLYSTVILSIAMIMIVMASVHFGTVTIPLSGAVESIFTAWGLPMTGAAALTEEQEAVLWFIRLPRIICGILVGTALATAGAVMQGIFSNPLADPSLLGVTAGASLGAVIAIAGGLSLYGAFYMPMCAFLGALLAVLIIILLALKEKNIHPVTLLLAGVAVSMFLSAMTSGILTFMNEHRLREFLFWIVGGLDYRSWEHVEIAMTSIVGGCALLFIIARHLNVLAMGETEARAVGMPVLFYRLLFLCVSAFITATAVCIGGSISFVGLIIPHMMRTFIGPDYRYLLPLSALGGAVFLVFCDTVGRVIVSPVEIRLGIVTALVGAPYFLYLLRRLGRNGEF